MSKNTYLYNAMRIGQIIHKGQAEPNQRWHFLCSWYVSKMNKDSNFGRKMAREWCGIKCPELLLWMAEASEVEGVKRVVEALISRNYENTGENRRKMEKYIKEELSWDSIISAVQKERQSKNLCENEYLHISTTIK